MAEPPLSLMRSLSRAGADLALTPLRGAAAVIEGGRTVERRTREGLRDSGERLMLEAFDTTVSRLLAAEAVDRVLERVEAAGVAQRVAERLFADGIAEQIADRAIAGPELERVVARAIEGQLPEVVVSRLLENPALWVLVDEIARSPSVTEAIAHQGTGFVEQVTGAARDRSRDADIWVERVARRVGRRRHRDSREGIEVSSPPLHGDTR
jgi:hypothetical protein